MYTDQTPVWPWPLSSYPLMTTPGRKDAHLNKHTYQTDLFHSGRVTIASEKLHSYISIKRTIRDNSKVYLQLHLLKPVGLGAQGANGWDVYGTVVSLADSRWRVSVWDHVSAVSTGAILDQQFPPFGPRWWDQFQIRHRLLCAGCQRLNIHVSHKYTQTHTHHCKHDDALCCHTETELQCCCLSVCLAPFYCYQYLDKVQILSTGLLLGLTWHWWSSKWSTTAVASWTLSGRHKKGGNILSFLGFRFEDARVVAWNNLNSIWSRGACV